MSGEEDEVATAFRAWVRDQSNSPNVLHSDGVEIYKGPRVYKSASVRVYGNRDNGSVSRTELRVGSYPPKEYEPGYDFARPDKTWACQDDQIDRVRALLNGEFLETGHYVRVQKDDR